MVRRKGVAEQLDPRVKDFLNHAEVGDIKRLQTALKSRKFEIDSDNDGVTALMLACGAGKLEAVQLLISRGAGMWCLGPRKDPMNPLMWAAYEGRLDIIRYFVEEVGIGKDGMNQQAGRSGFKTAMDCALERGEGHDSERSDHKYQVLAYLREKGAKFGEGVTDPAIVFEAAAAGDAHYVLYCVVSCPSHLTTRFGSDAYSLLHVAANAGHLELASVLLAYDIAVEARDRAGRTPLMMAAQGGHEPVVRLLMEHDARIDGRDLNSSTALHMACFSGHTACVKALLSRDGNATTTVARDGDGDGTVAREETVARGRPSEGAVAMLLARDAAGHTPLALAFSGGLHVPIIRYALAILDGAIDPAAAGKATKQYRNSELAQEAIKAHTDALHGNDPAAKMRLMTDSQLASSGSQLGKEKEEKRKESKSRIVRAGSSTGFLMRKGSTFTSSNGGADGTGGSVGASGAFGDGPTGGEGGVHVDDVTDPNSAAPRVGRVLERRATQFRVIPRRPTSGTLRVTRFLEAMQPLMWGFDSSLVFVISRADLMQAGGLPTYETALRAEWLVCIDDIPQGAQVLFLSHRHYGRDFPDKGNSSFAQVFRFLQSEVAGGSSDYIWVDFVCMPPLLDRDSVEFRRYMCSALTALLRCSIFLALPATVELEPTAAAAAAAEAAAAGSGPEQPAAETPQPPPSAAGTRGAAVAGSSGGGRDGGRGTETKPPRGPARDEEGARAKSRRAVSKPPRPPPPPPQQLQLGGGARTEDEGDVIRRPPARQNTSRRQVPADEKDAESLDESVYSDDVEELEPDEETTVALGGKKLDEKERPPLEAVAGGPVQEEPEEQAAAAGVQLYSDFVDLLSRGWVQMEASLALLLGLDMFLCIRWGLNVTYQPVLPEPLIGADGAEEQGAGFRGAALAAAAKVAPEAKDDPDLWEQVVRVFGGGTFPEDPSIAVGAAIADMVSRCEEPQQRLMPIVSAVMVLHDEGLVADFAGGMMEPLDVISRLSRPAMEQLKACFVVPGDLSQPEDRDVLVKVYLVALCYMMGLWGAPDPFAVDVEGGGRAVAARLLPPALLAGKPKTQLHLELQAALAKVEELEARLAGGEGGGAGGGHLRAAGSAERPAGAAAAPAGGGGCGCVVS